MSDKIYRRSTQLGDTPKKQDEHARFRNKYINFHVTAHEQELIQRRRELTGLSASGYYRQSLILNRILVKGNIKTWTAIRSEISDLKEHFTIHNNTDLTSLDDVQIMALKTIMEIMEYITMKEDSMASKKTYEERIKELQEKEDRLQKQKKELMAAYRKDERKKRNKRLINCGLAVREVLGRELTDEDAINLEDFLRRQEQSGLYFSKAMNPEEVVDEREDY